LTAWTAAYHLPAHEEHVIIRWIILVALGLISVGPVRADPTEDSLRIYAVHVLRNATSKSQTGYGIYLGKGLVITAAHVVASRQPGVRIAGRDLAASVVARSEFEELDLALLSIDEQMLPPSQRMRRLVLCRQPPRVGRSVVVAIPESTATSHIMSPLLLPPNLRERFPTVIPDVATTGNSGSGVFDAELKCLMGIMSRKIFARPPPGSTAEPKDLAKYFVPAATIAMFIANAALVTGLANPSQTMVPAR